MAAGNINFRSICSAASQQAGVRQRKLRVQAAKKGSSPWGTGGPKRGGGRADGSNGSASERGGHYTNGSGAAEKKTGGGTGTGPSAADSIPWKDTPKRQEMPSRRAKSGGGLGVGGGFGVSGAGAARARLASSRVAPPPETTFTDPVIVTLLDELSATESAPEPKWGTFCSHLGGEWVGQYAAYTPWEGKAEPAWLDERGKYINVVYTRALEQRAKYPAQDDSQGQAGPQHAAPTATVAVPGASPTIEETHTADLLIRKIGRCTKLAALPDLRLRPLQGGAPMAAAQVGQVEAEEGKEDDDDVDVEALTFNSDGVVVFDGANYSAGPEYIGQQSIKLVSNEAIVGLSEDEESREEALAARVRSNTAASTSAPTKASGRAASEDVGMDIDEDEDEESTLIPTSTSVFEQCLVDWGSRTRMRLKLTLRIGQLDNGEVDVEVLRILLFTEEWLGPASTERLTYPLDGVKVLARPCTDLPRPTPTQLQGSWNVFTVSATGIDEVDPLSGEEQVVWMYSSMEEQQLWDTSAAPPSGDDGGCFWLPGGIILSLRMVDNYVPVDLNLDSETDRSESGSQISSTGSRNNGNGNGNGNGAERTYPRGLCLGMGWLWREGSVSLIEREYDGYGYLREVRLGQAVKGGWSGGRM
ncbi:hypothetical protein Vafri_8382 [Volvox africanus]|nr:hypothetical protein Vafri_8382 [Volvox africanus]